MRVVLQVVVDIDPVNYAQRRGLSRVGETSGRLAKDVQEMVRTIAEIERADVDVRSIEVDW